MIPQPIKDFIRLLLVTLLPIAFVAIKLKFPQFPLSEDSFISLILWAVALLIGGWNAAVLWFKKFSPNFYIAEYKNVSQSNSNRTND